MKPFRIFGRIKEEWGSLTRDISQAWKVGISLQMGPIQYIQSSRLIVPHEVV